MVLTEIFERFVQESPICVMQRAVLENVFSADALNAIYHNAAEVQYERELLFSTVVDVTSLVVCRIVPSIRAAYLHLRSRIPVSLKAFYDWTTKRESANRHNRYNRTSGGGEAEERAEIGVITDKK